MRIVNGVSIYSDVTEILASKHTALLVVDMQNDGCLPNGWFADQGRDVSYILNMVPRVRTLVEAARKTGVFVVFVEQTTLRNNGSDSPAWLYFKTRDGRKSTDYTLEGSWGQQTLAELDPRQDEPRVRKNRPSAFHQTNLDLLLKAQGVESVLVCGTVTQGCVLATTLDASFHDYYTVVASDCVQSYDQELHTATLQFLRSRYDFVTVGETVAIWSSEMQCHSNPDGYPG